VIVCLPGDREEVVQPTSQSVPAPETKASLLQAEIVLPSLGAPVVWPVDAVPAELLDALVGYATAVAGGGTVPTGAPEVVGHAVPIRIGQEVVGVVAAIAGNGAAPSSASADDPAWLEAAAAAAAVTRLMPGQPTDSVHAVLESLVSPAGLLC